MQDASTVVRLPPYPSATRREPRTLEHRTYRVAFFVSLAVNVVLIGAIALYLHFAALFDAVEGAVSFLG